MGRISSRQSHGVRCSIMLVGEGGTLTIREIHEIGTDVLTWTKKTCLDLPR